MKKNELEEREITSKFLLPFGPQHPASGHFHALITVDGERIIKLVPYPGYLHRGFEKLMEYRTHVQNCMLVDRICILDPFSNEMGYVNVVEKIAGIEVPERAKFIRTIMAELGRILSHITWIGVTSMALGLDSGTRIAWGNRERIIRLNEIATGGRIYPCYFTPGGVRRDFPKGFKEKIVKELNFLEKQLKVYDSLVFENETFIMRMKGVGTFSAEEAIALGATGPNLRGCGIKADVRKDEPYEAYPMVDFNVVTMKDGDAYSRALVRRGELAESISIVRQLLEKMPEGKFRVVLPPFMKTPKGEAYFCCEAARGELCFHMVSDGSPNPYRVKVRGPSFSHTLSVFPYIVKGVYIADVPAIYWSLDPCPADMDR
ncbi:NADH-quinone oxidoreductase subunit D [Candidatus Bathyarchaeota archaeon]|nr:NADH-quinone oxidoreductase subunit D [Candidatus Bathyarchaeota archaeon]